MNEHVNPQFAALLNSFARVFHVEPNDRDTGDEQPEQEKEKTA